MSKRIVKTTFIFVFVSTLLRTLGFIRDTLIAQRFGTSAIVDAYYVSLKVLSSLRGFVENPLPQIFVPILSEYRAHSSQEKVKRLIATTYGTFGVGMLAVVCFCILTASYWIKVIAPGFDAYRFELATHFIKITFPYLVMISFCAFGIAAMNTYGQFWGVAFTPIWPSFALIAMGLGFSNYFTVPIASLAWGVLIGGVIQCLFVAILLKRLDLLTWPRIDFKDPGVLKVAKLTLPALVGASSAQIGLLINTNLASFLPVGTISWIHYADRLIYFPLSVIGISLSTALSPVLAKEHVTGNTQNFQKTLGWGLRCNLMIAIPIAITLTMLSGPLIVSLFAYGKFSAFDVLETQKALSGYFIGLPAFMLVKTLSSSFHARQDTRTPAKAVLLGVLVNGTLGMLLVPYLRQIGITLANSISSWIQILFLVYWSNYPIARLLTPPLGWRRWISSMLFMVLALVSFYAIFTPNIDLWLQWNWSARLFTLGYLGLGAVLIAGLSIAHSTRFNYRDGSMQV